MVSGVPRVGTRRVAAFLCIAGAAAFGAHAVSADQTVYIGDGRSSDPVTVNLDVLDAGSSAASPRAAEGTEVRPGALVEGPGGAVLHFPPMEKPRSRLAEDLRDLESGHAERGGNFVALPRAKPEDPAKDPIVIGGDETAPLDDGDPATRPATEESSSQEVAAPVPSGKPLRIVPQEKPVVAVESADNVVARSEDDAEAARTKDTATADADRDGGEASEEMSRELRDSAAGDVATEAGDGIESAPEQVSEDVQSAARPATESDDGNPLRLAFQTGSAELSGEARARLAQLAEDMKEDPRRRIQLLAYAEANEDQASHARRLSLSRALSVRAFLIDEGIRSTRIDVRALGNTFEEGPPDRVDIQPIAR